ncbi:hypothetical protein Bca4012_080972 [Brassica carinata]
MCDGLIAFPTLTLIITTMTVIQRQIKQSKKLLLLSVYSDYSTDSIATTNVGAGELRSDPLIPVTLTPSR